MILYRHQKKQPTVQIFETANSTTDKNMFKQQDFHRTWVTKQVSY